MSGVEKKSGVMFRVDFQNFWIGFRNKKGPNFN